jgi:hypothetical protein
MKQLNRFLAFILFLLVVSCSQNPSINPEITKDELFAHVDFLASDSLMGRQPGTPYDRVAAKYIKDAFETNEFTLMDKNGYQFFDFVDYLDFGENNYLSVNKVRLTFGVDFIPLPFSSSDSISASVVFVGYGIKYSSQDLVWDDYSNINVNGKWVLILRGSPKPDDMESPMSKNASDRSKAMVAKDQGAAGVIFVSGTNFDSEDKMSKTKLKTFSIGIPVVHVKRIVANLLLGGNEMNIAALEGKIVKNQKPNSFVLGANVCARTQIVTKKKNTQNIIGLVEGTDPLYRNQYIVVGAHYDHLGMGGVGSSSRKPDTLAVHNGADDNASGVAAIIEIGQKLARYRPKRSIVFVAFGAEELGLLGSRFFLESGLVSADSIVAMINIDMIGRLSSELELQVGGVKTAIEIETILNEVNQKYNLNLLLSPQGYGPSDHAVFYSENIPVLFFSTGPHLDYHTPFDITSRINFDGLKTVTSYISDVISTVANQTSKLSFQQAGPAVPTSRHGQELKVKLGIMPDVSGVISDGLKVLAVTENLPAWVAGIKSGDIITSINGKSVNNIQDYMFRLQEISIGNTVSMEYRRNGEKRIVLVQF